ncbi:hypothetical protein PAXINDRAFT_48567, partial [Paxillus involutus ATCC 200175]
IENSPDLYLDELQEMLATSCGVHVSRATVWRTLHKAGFMMKKVSILTRTTPCVYLHILRCHDSTKQSNLSLLTKALSIAEQPTVAAPGQSEEPKRNARHFFFSVLPALSLQDGFLHCSIVEGSFCTESFTSFIRGLLDNMQPFPAPNSVIVMDNCRIHKHPDIQELIE